MKRMTLECTPIEIWHKKKIISLKQKKRWGKAVKILRVECSIQIIIAKRQELFYDLLQLGAINYEIIIINTLIVTSIYILIFFYYLLFF